jgi:hypothetical protein
MRFVLKLKVGYQLMQYARGSNNITALSILLILLLLLLLLLILLPTELTFKCTKRKSKSESEPCTSPDNDNGTV